jgi:hypothetical protein
LSTSNHTDNYNLSQYASGDPVKFLTNYNQDMATIDAAIKAAKDRAETSVPSTRTVAGLPLSNDLTLAQLYAAGCASGDSSGNAKNALMLGGIAASSFPQVSDGSWTPTLFGDTAAGSPTYAARDGNFYKIGRLVIVSFLVQLSAKGGMAGNICVGGLPFAGAFYGCGAVTIPASSGFSLPVGGAGLFGSVDPSGIGLLYGETSYNGKVTAGMIGDSFILYSHAFGAYLSAS